MTLNGPGANLLTVRRPDSVANFRIFNIPGGITGGVAISGMTITGGRVPGDFGGGIYSRSNLTLTNVHLTGNNAATGGGIYLENAATFNLIRSVVSSNTADQDGGGMELRGNVTLTNSTISGNTANSPSFAGAGVAFVNNVADSLSFQVTNCTIANNMTGTANTGGGILTIGTGTIATTTLRNTIIANNAAPNLRTVVFGGGTANIVSQGFNLASDNGGGFLNVAPITTDQINANAGLAPLALNGGTTPTHLLLFGSAAIDAGNNTGSGQTTDQRGGGVRRTVDLPGIANAPGSDGTDIGALELAGGPFTITSIVRLPNGHILLQGLSEPGAVTIQAAADPNAASFSNLMSPATADASGFWQYDDAGAIGQTKRFYRATLP